MSKNSIRTDDRYYYVTYLNKESAYDKVTIPTVAKYDFETYKRLNNFSEIKMIEIMIFI